MIKLCCALFLAFFWSLLPPDAHHPRMRINPGRGRYQTLLLGFKSSIFLWYKHIPKFSNQSASFYTLIITCQGHISDVSVFFEFLNWCFQTSWKSYQFRHNFRHDLWSDWTWTWNDGTIIQTEKLSLKYWSHNTILAQPGKAWLFSPDHKWDLKISKCL